MNDPTPEAHPHPIVDFTDADLAGLLRRSARLTALLGLVIAIAVAFTLGWGNGALVAVGAVISVASIFEWGRLIRLFNARLDASMDAKRLPRGAVLAILLFLLRLLFFAAAIYGSLKFLHGSAFSLIGGLALAVLALVWEALRVLRGANATR